MRNAIVTVCCLLTCLIASQAMAKSIKNDEARPYLTLSAGASSMSTVGVEDATVDKRVSSRPGFNGMIAVGLAWDVGRIELSASGNHQKFDKQQIAGNETDLTGNLTAYTLLGSVFYDFNKDGAVSPYFGAGLGAARIDLNSVGLAGNDALTFAYQLGAGLTLNTSDDFVVDIGYRMLGTNRVDFGGTTADYLIIHNANMGLRFLF